MLGTKGTKTRHVFISISRSTCIFIILRRIIEYCNTNAFLFREPFLFKWGLDMSIHIFVITKRKKIYLDSYLSVYGFPQQIKSFLLGNLWTSMAVTMVKALLAWAADTTFINEETSWRRLSGFSIMLQAETIGEFRLSNDLAHALNTKSCRRPAELAQDWWSHGFSFW